MSRLRLTFACGDYDRTRAIEDGSVRVDGVDLTYLRLPVEETFFRMLRHQEFDVAELSLSSYVATLDALDEGDEAPFVALPVYTSRQFRHGGIFVNVASGIRTPADLRGRRIGLPEYQLTACVWQRGILADEHGLPLDASTFHTGGQECPGRPEKRRIDVPFDVRPIPRDRTLSDLLATGEIDALMSPRIPSSFGRDDRRVARLFPDPVVAERAYYLATGIFPIMHVVVVRRHLYERHRWVAQSLTKALTEAKDRACARIRDTSALRYMEPWLAVHLEEARALMGRDYWSYGLGEADQRVLETFLRYHHEQGLSRALRTPAELFAPESLEAFVI